MRNANNSPISTPSAAPPSEDRSVRPPMNDEDGGVADASLIDWAMADRVARWTARRPATPPAYRPAAMQRDFDEMTERAEGLVAEATGLAVVGNPARGRGIDRPDWVGANVASFQRLLGPTMAKVAAKKPATPLAGAVPGLSRQLAGVSRSVSGTQ